MPCPVNKPQRALLSQIVKAIEKCGCLTDAVLTYVDTTLFPPEPSRLTELLNDDTNCDRDSLLDLIFYPDASIQKAMEPLLEAARCSADGEAVLLDLLIARDIGTWVNLPDGRPLVHILVPDFVKSQYLKRLNISWQMDSEMAATIETGVLAAHRNVVKVRLRNAGIRFADNQRLILCQFFEKMADSEPDYMACLDLVISLLESSREDADGYLLLADLKRSLFRSLQQAKRFDKMLRQSNMETLMLQGVRTPHVAPDEIRYQMGLIDRITFGIYGKTESITPPWEEPIKQVPDLDSPETVVRSLL